MDGSGTDTAAYRMEDQIVEQAHIGTDKVASTLSATAIVI